MTVGVRFRTPLLRYFRFRGEPPPLEAYVVVRTGRGLEVGKVRTPPRKAKEEGEVVRLATKEDLDRAARLRAQAEEVLFYLRARLKEEGVQAKVLGCDFTLDGSHLTVHYAAAERVNLRRLGRELGERYGARVEFLAEGPREEAQYLGTLGACGMESCCSTWLQGFAPVSIKLARDQQLPLNPEKISGPCGRLLCCLTYEHPVYQELLKELPKKNARVCTREGVCGKVQKVNPLKGTVELHLEDGKTLEVSKEELA
ncbi:Cell fate regulator YaaT, PSP1 superfamily (controls sporulation, competence, biofilm development) [Thermus arciformis]|uniref:Cell fate regulator YaaT, PSP1 superfamily (Controls sporulation, competence, biofilm development) n=1 Tax=Thermus arciformis TaxID=482827 RepID=A0A1G7K1Z8_9DEIN|nr:regulatory iron-sulfur-containing complex subunit RicT [Thermus arciformis]SDF31157.1 Cell fate regulator YaaT, PSP1 superfamily (controls sporulation, competence, biofilm development) [Thermus arciformis]